MSQPPTSDVTPTAEAAAPALPQTATNELAYRPSLFKERTLALVLLALVIWVAHFWRSSEFGLYEDDWAFIAHPMGWPWSKVSAWAVGAFHNWWLQGRPVGFAATAISVFFANGIGGLEGVYAFAFLLHLVNAFLVFLLTRRQLSVAPSLCAALGFALLPSNTSVALLTNALFMGFATFFCLTALWVYLGRMRLISYLLAVCSLLTFESAFLPFFAAPLFGNWDKQLPRRLIKHWIILLTTGVVVFWLRSRMGEAKTAAVLADGVPATLQRIAVAISLGPLTTLYSSIARGRFVLEAADRDIALIAGVFLIALSVTLYYARLRISETVQSWPGSIRAFGYRLQITVRADEETAAALRVGVSGAAMLIMAYGLAISSDTYPPVVLAGRLSGCTHMGAAAGFGLLLGAAMAVLLDLASGVRLKLGMAILLGGYFAALGSFHYLVQRDYAASWNMQRTFWRSVVKECPDITDGTVLLFEDYAHPLRFVETNSWADPHVLPLLYGFPQTWSDPPQLFSVSSNWRSEVVKRGGDLVLPAPFGAWPDRTLENGRVILLKANGAGVRRITGSTTIGDQILTLKPVQDTTIHQYRRGPLYTYVLSAE